MRLIVAVLLTLMVSLAVAHAAPVVLLPSDTAMGKTIAKWMQDEHKIGFDIKEDKDGGDPTIMRTEKGVKVGDFPFVIVSVPYGKDDAGKVTERMVVLMVVSQIKVPDAKRGKVFETMNKLNDDNDYTHLYIDSDNEVAFRWALVVPGSGLPIDAVWDAYSNMVPAWEAAGEAINKVLK